MKLYFAASSSDILSDPRMSKKGPFFFLEEVEGYVGFPKILLFVWPCSFDSKLPGTLAAQQILWRTETAVGHGGSFHHRYSVETQVMPKICQHPFLIRHPQQALQNHPNLP